MCALVAPWRGGRAGFGWWAAVTATFALVHSPLVGPTTWVPAARALEARGRRAVVPRWPVAESLLAADVSGPLVLVGHSGAGRWLPLIGSALADAGTPVAAYVFADATLPGETFPSALVDPLDDGTGTLPPWPQWWPEGTMEALVPDADLRAAVEAECEPVDRATLDGVPPVPPQWPDAPCAYLSFTYEPEAQQAERDGWPCARVPDALHLHQLVAPGDVADALLILAATGGVVT
jgi:hypothetical protein